MTPRGVLISGGTGFIGTRVIPALLARGIGVWVWSRDAARARRGLPAAVHVVGALGDIPVNAPMLVEGQRVRPRRLLDAGFEFRHPVLERALVDLV
jgi:NAD dependent epimerase/dehydratase family enzyme